MSTRASLIHIDSHLKGSHYRWALWLGIAVSLLALIGWLPLLATYRFALGCLVLASLWLAQLSRRHLLAISTLVDKKWQFHDAAGLAFLDWQIQWAQGYFRVPWGQTQAIYQGKLLQISDLGAVMLLVFMLEEPIKQRQVFEVWQDQVDATTWQQLKRLAY